MRCWPELRDHHKLTMCAAHSLLSQEGIPSSCEVDLPALITTYVLNQLAGAPAFNFDVTGYLEEEDAIQFAHCGAAAPALAARLFQRASACSHAHSDGRYRGVPV